MKTISILGTLLCSAVLFVGCSGDTSGQMMCDATMAAVVTGCTQPLVCTGTMRACRNAGADGCDTDISNDVNNCGACATKCQLPPHGAAVCQNSTCGVTSCELSYKDCNNNPADGCEVDTARDPNNCGGCGIVCAGASNASGACVGGKCVLACNPPYLDCNNSAADGCEINGNNDLQNCGSCKNACPTPPNGNPACAGGTCIVSACTAPYLTCKPGPVNGCETNTATDVNNCSACGDVCPQVAHGTPGCLSSACGVGSCFAPYKDCNKIPTDGCEIDTSTSVMNCGACGNPCPAVANGTAGCAASTCGIGSCNTNFGDCNNNASDGCEANTLTDSNNCGKCGNMCPSGQFCSSGSCVSDPCQNYGGTSVILSANARVCGNTATWGSWDPTKIPAPWQVCTLAQWMNYAPSVTPQSLGLGTLWINNSSCGTGFHREVWFAYAMNDASCYNGPSCCHPDTDMDQFVICSP